MQIDLDSPNQSSLRKVAQVTRQGGVLFYPSDTVYGLGCDPFQPSAVERLLRIKKRSIDKGLLLLTPNLYWVEECCSNIPKVFYELARDCWPGPITFLLKANTNLSPLICGKRGKVGFRRPKGVFLEQWMHAIEGPLVSTSANLSGRPPAQSLKELREMFGPWVDLFVEAGEVRSQPSIVVDLTRRRPCIVRGEQGIEPLVSSLCPRSWEKISSLVPRKSAWVK